MAWTLLNHGDMQLRALSHCNALSLAQSAESAFDPDSFDFTAYLSRRLGVDVELTKELLGAWLKGYEQSELGSPALEAPPTPTEARRPSGVYSLAGSGEAETRRTGTHV